MSGAALVRADCAGEARALAALDAMTLDALLLRAAQSRPEALALAGSPDAQSWTFAGLNAEVSRVAGRLTALELDAGATVLVSGAASPHTLIAALATMRAGLRTALAPLGFGPAGLADACAACGATALIGAGGHEFGDVRALLAAAAAAAPGVRLVATCGTGAGNGIVNLDEEGDSAALDEGAAALAPVTFARNAVGFLPVEHSAAKLAASALALLRCLPGVGSPVLSTLAPVTLAGLISGPMAAWISAGTLWLHGPFECRTFAQTLERAGGAHVIAPASLADDFQGLDELSRAFASLTLMHRNLDTVIPPPLQSIRAMECIIDLYALGESAVLASPREGRRVPRSLPGTARYINVAGYSTLAVECRQNTAGGLDIRGAATNAGKEWRPA